MLSSFPRFFALLFLALAARAEADTVAYTFDAPAFVVGQTTPLFDRPPQFGNSSFRADFTSLPSINGFFVTTFSASPLFNGQSLADPFPPSGADTLRITLNMPVTSVQLDFALFAPGHLELISSAGRISAPVVPGVQWGTLSFIGGSPFTQFDLQGFAPSNQPTQFGIDNLSMTLVPEPSTLGLLSVGLLSALPVSRARRRGSFESQIGQ